MAQLCALYSPCQAAVALEHRSKGLPDSSDPVRQYGLQGQVLAVPANWNVPSHSLTCSFSHFTTMNAAPRGVTQSQSGTLSHGLPRRFVHISIPRISTRARKRRAKAGRPTTKDK